jgi:hypothetical protein
MICIVNMNRIANMICIVNMNRIVDTKCNPGMQDRGITQVEK